MVVEFVEAGLAQVVRVAGWWGMLAGRRQGLHVHLGAVQHVQDVLLLPLLRRADGREEPASLRRVRRRQNLRALGSAGPTPHKICKEESGKVCGEYII